MSVAERKYTLSSIELEAGAFRAYLQGRYAQSGLIEDLDKLACRKKGVYIFSGVIRDYFLGSKDAVRDLDIVITGKLSDKDIEHSQYIFTNSFGGKKIIKNGETIDMWSLSKTWGIKKMRLPSSESSLLMTPFFNFSAIVYDYKDGKFIARDDFVNFLNTRVIDYVYSENPYPELCIINSIYYHHKLGYKLSPNLGQWLYKQYVENIYDFDAIQQHHFGNVVFSREEISDFVNSLIR